MTGPSTRLKRQLLAAGAIVAGRRITRAPGDTGPMLPTPKSA